MPVPKLISLISAWLGRLLHAAGLALHRGSRFKRKPAIRVSTWAALERPRRPRSCSRLQASKQLGRQRALSARDKSISVTQTKSSSTQARSGRADRRDGHRTRPRSRRKNPVRNRARPAGCACGRPPGIAVCRRRPRQWSVPDIADAGLRVRAPVSRGRAACDQVKPFERIFVNTKGILRAVAMMHVEIDHGNALGTVRGAGVQRRHTATLLNRQKPMGRTARHGGPAGERRRKHFHLPVTTWSTAADAGACRAQGGVPTSGDTTDIRGRARSWSRLANRGVDVST